MLAWSLNTSGVPAIAGPSSAGGKPKRRLPPAASDENRRCETLDEMTRLPAEHSEPAPTVDPSGRTVRTPRTGEPARPGKPATPPTGEAAPAPSAAPPALTPTTPVPVPTSAPTSASDAAPSPVRVPAAAPDRRTADATAPVGIAALLRLAVVAVDPDGRISYWNRGAEELFGHRWEAVFGARAIGLLTVPASVPVPAGDTPPGRHGTADGPSPAPRDAFGLLDDLTAPARPAWAGGFPVADRDGAVRDTLWWSYRIIEPAGRSLLILAASAKPLRSGGFRLGVGDRLLPYALEAPPGEDGLRVTARLAHTGTEADAARLAEGLAAVLPRVSSGRLDRIVRQIGPLGHPALEVEGATPFAVLPYEAEAAGPVGSPVDARADEDGTPQRPELLPAPRPQTPNGTPRTATAQAHTSQAHVRGAEGPRTDGPPAERPRTDKPRTTRPRTDRPLTDRPRTDRPRADRPRTEGPPTDGPRTDASRPRGPQPPRLAPIPDFPRVPPGNVLDEQLALLRETGARVGTTLELETTAAELCSVAVPRFADFANVLVVDRLYSDATAELVAFPDRSQRSAAPVRPTPSPSPEDSSKRSPKRSSEGGGLTVRRIAAAGRNPGSAWESALPEGALITLPGDQVPGLYEPFLLPVVDPAVAADLAADLGVPALGPLLPSHSLLITPLTARGTVLGVMWFVRHPRRRPFDGRDTATAVELAARGAVHLDNARLHRQESRAAATLQRSMLPTSPPRIPGVRIAHHYRPGDRQAQVGGDWFDAIQLPGARVALIVGDVMGHGLLSAAVMGQFRTAVQTMAALDLPPAQLLRHLDNLAHRLGVDHLATCVYAVYDPIHRTLHLANAGHIPPVLARHDGRSELLQIPQGAPIGVGGVPFETVEIPVPDGSWLVLCTDGLVEVRGQGIDAGLAALCANVIEPQQTPEDVCNQILSRVHTEDRRDDVALLVARFEGIAPDDVAEWQLSLDPSEVRTARALTRKQLADWGLGHLGDLTELLVSELVTNALRVATHEVQLRLMRVGTLLVEVSDDDHNLPQLRRADEDDENGRGLALVSNLSHRWGTSRKAVGKVVWFELPLPGA